MDSNHRSLSRRSRFSLRKANCGDGRGADHREVFLLRGTDGSNPSPSSSESRANLTFGTHHSPIRCLARNLGQDCGIKPRRRRHYWLLGRREDKTVEQVTTIAQTAAEHTGSCFPRGKGYPAPPAFLRSRAAPAGLVRIVDFGNGRGSDYRAAPGSLGVEFTITSEPELRTPIAGAHLCFRAPDREAGARVSRRCGGGWRQR